MRWMARQFLFIAPTGGLDPWGLTLYNNVYICFGSGLNYCGLVWRKQFTHKKRYLYCVTHHRGWTEWLYGVWQQVRFGFGVFADDTVWGNRFSNGLICKCRDTFLFAVYLFRFMKMYLRKLYLSFINKTSCYAI